MPPRGSVSPCAKMRYQFHFRFAPLTTNIFVCLRVLCGESDLEERRTFLRDVKNLYAMAVLANADPS